MQDFLVNIALPGSLIMAAIAAGLAIIFPILKTFSDPKGAVKSIAGIGFIALIFIIAYSVAGTDNPSQVEIADGTSKLISAGLITCGALAALTAVGLVFSLITDLFK